MVEKPFAYKGNTYAAHLTEAVRCRIKRRLATRAAARSAGLRLFETWADSNLRVCMLAQDCSQLVHVLHHTLYAL